MQLLQPNTTLQGGKYKIIRTLGQGGFGITYLAKQRVAVGGPLGKIDVEVEVTIKEFFMKDLCNRDESTKRVSVPSLGSAELVEKFKKKFLKEAVNISKLNHPNIIKVLDVFEENGTAYYVMEYIQGGSLSELIKEKGCFSEKETLCYTSKIASALQYIHAQKMNHLDIKPANVLLRPDGDIVLIDFGLSKNYDVTGEQTTSTPVGVSVGYAPIEQSRVGGVGSFSPATDIYSLGATMYKMLTGETPPEASAIIDDGLPLMSSSISDNTKNVIIKAMEPRRKDRFQSMEEFIEALTLENVEKEKDVVLSEETKIVVPQHQVVDATTEDEATVLITDVMIQESQIETAEIVDLGLSVKWCSHNLGAFFPQEAGTFFAWGIDVTKGNTLDWNVLDEEIAGSQYDAAYMMKRGRWRTPTRKQFKELIDKCRWTWFEYKGVWGYKVTGVTGKSIFLPAAGKLNNAIPFQGYYWSSSKSHVYNTAHYLYFNSEDFDLAYEPINVQRTIRAVYY